MPIVLVVTGVLGIFTFFWGWGSKKVMVTSVCFGVMLAGTVIGGAIETGLISVGKTTADISSNLQ